MPESRNFFSVLTCLSSGWFGQGSTRALDNALKINVSICMRVKKSICWTKTSFKRHKSFKSKTFHTTDCYIAKNGQVAASLLQAC